MLERVAIRTRQNLHALQAQLQTAWEQAESSDRWDEYRELEKQELRLLAKLRDRGILRRAYSC